ncbi:hypothetical protein RJ639_007396 [Escallonia herrerae]|uniref:Cytochrome c oxidase assembly factor 3 mitochondrial coiled-coil domain-containing protein n=1 Tax=Escallonia herrerae TaxID=1293975 RepID=A0AA89AUD6_9ASTE|nr:hypothetical protein RJ639_007396 [Escallonia herrerae]
MVFIEKLLFPVNLEQPHSPPSHFTQVFSPNLLLSGIHSPFLSSLVVHGGCLIYSIVQEVLEFVSQSSLIGAQLEVLDPFGSLSMVDFFNRFDERVGFWRGSLVAVSGALVWMKALFAYLGQLIERSLFAGGMAGLLRFNSLAPKTKNLIVAGGLTGFVFGVYFYTMRAVGGTDELQVAIDKFESQKGKNEGELASKA